MPTLPIPFTQLNRSIDKPGLSYFNQSQYDGFWQEYDGPNGLSVAWAKRPGLTEFADVSQPGRVDGLYYWNRQQNLISVCNGEVHKINQVGTATSLTGTATMTAQRPPTFADEQGTNLYIASGGKIGDYPISGPGAYLTDADAPTSVRFIGTINKILVALRDSDERFDWAQAGDPTDWQGDYANAEAQPDLARAFHVSNFYLHFFGQNTYEPWRHDGSTMVRETQGVVSRGIGARYSAVNIQGNFYFLDNTLEVIRLSGFIPTVVSNPSMTRYIKTFSTVDDAIGFYLPVQGRHFYVLSFPIEEKTLVYDIVANQWYEWSYWSASSAEHKRYLGNCSAYADDWQKVYVGSRENSKIYEVTGTTDDGDSIRTVLQTDAVNRGDSSRYKFSKNLTLIFKRSDTSTTPNSMLISWRESNSSNWSNERKVKVEAQGAHEVYVNVRRLGRYKSRVWRFVMSDNSQSALISAMEDFEYGG